MIEPFTFTTQAEIRAVFWQGWEGERPRKLKTGDWPTDVRVAFVDFIDGLHRDGRISDALADRATL